MRPLVVLGLLLGTLVPTASAATVGASGECYDADASRGGEDKAELDTEDPTDPTLPSGTGAAAAVVLYATDRAALGLDGCKRYDCGVRDAPPCAPGQRPRADYLEAHALGVQACYQRGGIWIDGKCPTTPAGP